MTAGKPAAQEAAWDSDALFRALTETAVDGIVVIDARGAVQLYNSACERLFGYAANEVIGRNVNMLMPEPYRHEHDGYLASYKKSGDKKIIGIGREVSGRRKDGSVFPMYLSVGEGHTNEQRFFVGIIHDLTALRTEISRGDDASRLLAQIVESSTDAVISKTLTGEITSWNAAAERIFGYSAHEAIGRNITMIYPPERLSEERENIARISRGEIINHFITVRRRKDGKDIDVSLSMAPVRDRAGAIAGVSATTRDITEQRRAEAHTHALQAELAHVARLSAMGQMSAAIAHELNQPLTAAANYVKAAQRFLAGTIVQKQIDSARDAMDKAAGQVIRAGTIIRYLREFVEKRDSVRSREDINPVIRESVALCFVGGLNSNVKVSLDLDETLPPVPINKVQIQQVLTNLIRNSVEAMEDVRERQLKLTSQSASGHVRILVKDSGPGFDDDARARLFQPFMTTKDTGMGMGLKICQSLVEAHDGTIRLLPDHPGSTFEILLPLSRADDETISAG
jgi:two-component system sensor kinase FixL